ncbi:hypothetical protein AB6A23_18740 [Paenibacillus tarimensis]
MSEKSPIELLRDGYSELENKRANEQDERKAVSGVGDVEDVLNEDEAELNNPTYWIAKGYEKMNK